MDGAVAGKSIGGKLSLKRENVFKTLLNVSSFGIKVTKMLRVFIYSEHRFIVCGV